MHVREGVMSDPEPIIVPFAPPRKCVAQIS
jgi:hypothetical protein